MIDTIRFSGAHLRAAFVPDSISFFSTKKKGQLTERAIFSQVQKHKYYRILFDGGRQRYTVEINPHKMLYQYNIYNYEKDTNVYLLLVYGLARHFFSSLDDVYLSRVDIGGVHDFGDIENAKKSLELFRTTKPENVRWSKAMNQTYETAVFYNSKGYSIKIYMKLPEMERTAKKAGYDIPKEIADFSAGLLRFEKTYRTDELNKIGMPKTPFLGIHIHDFNPHSLYADFENTFKKWEQRAAPHRTDRRGIMGLLQTISNDNHENFAGVARSGIVSRQTISRFYKLKKEQTKQFVLNFENNLPKKFENVLNNTLTLQSFSKLM